MDAQKLKELRREVELAQKHGTTPDISAWDLFEVLNIAERAVSPAESVPISEHPEVVELRRHDHEVATRITHALMAERDEARAKIAAAHAEGVKQERKEADDCARYQASQIVELRKKVEEAHAEGRRSAMEELHPQWLEEKERADRAEAERDNLNDVAEKRRKEILRLDKLLAARQAPDPRDWLRVAHKHGYSFPDKRMQDFVADLLNTGTAQPLQQEGGKDAARYRFLRHADLDECAAKYWPDGQVPEGSAFDAAIDAAMLDAPQPSDNLQQASTAQVESAKKESQ